MKPFYALIGNPVEHSLSQQLHLTFAKLCGVELQYICCQLPVHSGQLEFKAWINHFVRDGGVGFNVTAPFKQSIFGALDRLTPTAQQCGAVNTVYFSQGKSIGDNTDGKGLVAYLHSTNLTLAGSKVLILGAGGAARGILGPLLGAGASIEIYNRTQSKALNMTKEMGSRPCCTVNQQQAVSTDYDLIINATSAAEPQKIIPLSNEAVRNTTLIDLNYKKGGLSGFSQYGQALGAQRCYDGLGMLVYQGKFAFELWTQKTVSAVQAQLIISQFRHQTPHSVEGS